MKKNLILAGAAILALTFTACNKNESSEVESSSNSKTITLTLSGISTATRASSLGSGDAVWDADATVATVISQYDIYFTNTSGAIKYAYRLDANGTYANQFAAITGSNPCVRFVGLVDVYTVYVVANDPNTALTTSNNISELAIALYDDQTALNDQNEIMYVGGGAISSIGTENDLNVDFTNATIYEEDDVKDMYYTAEVTVRPIVSRLEISKIEAIVSGSKEGTMTIDGEDYTYNITWSGFAPTLSGIYMSNILDEDVYPVPATTTTDGWFTTPSANKISGTTGLWDTEKYTDLTISDDCNADGVTLYTSGSDASLFGDTPSTSTSPYVYFNGGTTTCVPFNFIVPYDVMATEAETDAVGLDYEPRFHFRLVFPDTQTFTIESLSVTDESGNTYATGTDVYNVVASRFDFTSTADGVYYANIVSFLDEDGNEVDITPHTIYTIEDVAIYPYNLSVSTDDNTDYNIIVKVTVANYVEKEVTPVFGTNN